MDGTERTVFRWGTELGFASKENRVREEGTDGGNQDGGRQVSDGTSWVLVCR